MYGVFFEGHPDLCVPIDHFIIMTCVLNVMPDGAFSRTMVCMPCDLSLAFVALVSLKHIPLGFEGHPLRKDFPLTVRFYSAGRRLGSLTLTPRDTQRFDTTKRENVWCMSPCSSHRLSGPSSWFVLIANYLLCLSISATLKLSHRGRWSVTVQRQCDLRNTSQRRLRHLNRRGK
jgi:hypothetical protein